MIKFDNWCDSVCIQIKNHKINVITSRPADKQTGIDLTANLVPSHYIAENRVARALERLGKTQAAKMLTELLPEDKKIRSGDLGEIYATEWINTYSGYQAPIKRLRWKDHRNMAMRGEDVIGMIFDHNSQRLLFLKTEAKSRSNLSTKTLNEARAGLDKNDGLPSPHALSFIAARLLELNELTLADAIDDTLLRSGIPKHNVCHLLFTLSGNHPQQLLEKALKSYAGSITQLTVGLHINQHADFIREVYEKIVDNANQS